MQRSHRLTFARNGWFTFCLVAALSGAPGFSYAVDPTADARAHYQAGTTHYNLGRFDEAIAEYRRAYELKADPVFLFNIAQSYRQLGDHERALFFYRRFLSTAPDTQYRAEVTSRIEELQKKVAAAHPAPPPENAGAADRPPLAPAPVAPDPAAAHAIPDPAGQIDGTPADRQDAPPLWTRWWLWTAVGAVAAITITAVLIAGSGNGNDIPRTDLGHARFY